MTIPIKIPFLDLSASHVELTEELVSVFRSALKSATFVGGPMLEDFEQEFAQVCDTRYCVGVSSGTDALRFSLIAAGVAPGEAVITVPNTFIATTEAISQAGAYPEFVDIDERTYNMDPAELQAYLEDRSSKDSSGKLISKRSGRPVTAVVPVHLYGQTADMDPILDLAKSYGLSVVEDACQAHGAEYFSRRQNRWMKAGSMGTTAAFSFYPGKNLGACGEAGAVTTDDPRIADVIKMLRDHGQTRKYYHEMEGYNGRLDAIQAGILLAKLQYLAEWNCRRRDRAAEYKRLFDSTAGPISAPYEPSWSRAVYHLYVVRVDDRDALMFFLKDQGIGTGIHYPIPLHLQKAYQGLGYSLGDFPVTERVAAEIVSLPMYPQLTAQQQARVVRMVLNFAENEAADKAVSNKSAKLEANRRTA